MANQTPNFLEKVKGFFKALSKQQLIAIIAAVVAVAVLIPVIILLGRYALRAVADYRRQRKEGKEPVFHAKDIDLPHETDYWNE